jgi:hypothetical protein
MIPLNSDKHKNSDQYNTIVYTLDNLMARGIEPFAIPEKWGSIWAIESAVHSLDNGMDVDKVFNTERKGIKFIKRIKDEIIKRKLNKAVPENKLNIIKNTYDQKIYSKILLKANAEKLGKDCFKELYENGEWMIDRDFWGEIAKISKKAESAFSCVSDYKKKFQNIYKHEVEMENTLKDLSNFINDEYIHTFGLYSISNGGILLHACYVGGNKIIEIHDNGKVKIRRDCAEFKLKKNKTMESIIKIWTESGSEINDKLSLPFDISQDVNDYDTLYLMYAQENSNQSLKGRT